MKKLRKSGWSLQAIGDKFGVTRERVRQLTADISAAEKKRRRANQKVAIAVLSGKLQKQPCEVCGALVVEAHHEDYDKPLDVHWLCRYHHGQRHAELGDNTLKSNYQRIQERRAELTQIAQALGFGNWSAFETYLKRNRHRQIVVSVGRGKSQEVRIARPSRAATLSAQKVG